MTNYVHFVHAQLIRAHLLSVGKRTFYRCLGHQILLSIPSQLLIPCQIR